MSLLVYKIADYSFTAEREQYRRICELLKQEYAESNDICLFLANYNIYDSELDGIIFKNDAVISIEFKNYGGNITAVENGSWTLDDGTIIMGGSRKNPYQQAKINHVHLKQGLLDGMILPATMLRNIPAVIIFNQPISCNNRLSGRVQSWLHITDNEHFIQKLNDITEPHTDLSNEDIIELIHSLNLQEEWLDTDYSNDVNSNESCNANPDTDNGLPFTSDVDEEKSSIDKFNETPSPNIKKIDKNNLRISSDNIESLQENEIFVFGSNLAGKHIGGAARKAYQSFGAEWGVGTGPTGNSYAIPTMHGGIEEIAPYISEFIDYASQNPDKKFLVTKIGCGVARFRPQQIAPLFSRAINIKNIYLPAEFWIYLL